MDAKVIQNQSGNITEKKALHTRQANFELLRIVSMLMVVSLHYLSKGGALLSFQETFTGNTYLAYFLESCSVVAVNVFILLSGYFMVKAPFKTNKIVGLIGQVMFYSLGISSLLLATGLLPKYGFYNFINDIFPIQMEHYWFITAYILLYLFMPLLNKALTSMNQKNLKYLIILLLVFFSLPKTVLPIQVTIDHKGYDVVWFLCVYLIAAYIRLFGISFFKDRKKATLTYGILVMLSFVRTLFYGYFFRYTGKLEEQVLEAFQYNHLLNIGSAIAFFYIFYYLEIKDRKISGIILKVSPYVLGVYLLHEQLNVRYLWTEWFDVEKFNVSPFFLIHYLVVIFIIFVAGVLADALRHYLALILSRTPGIRTICFKCSRVMNSIDTMINS